MNDRCSALEAHFNACRAFFAQYDPQMAAKLVGGTGCVDSPVVLVGEAPGTREALEGKPFVGAAGKRLNEFLDSAGIRRESLYITNTVKFRPTAISKAGREVNRPPTDAEIERFAPFLLQELEILSPRWIVSLGNVPLRVISGNRRANISAMHGKPVPAVVGAAMLYPMYHPAAVIYNPKIKPLYEADLANFKRLLEGDGA